MRKTISIPQKLAKIKRVFKVNQLLSIETNKEYIQKYYLANKLAYSLFHTVSDKMYMGISRDGIYKEDDLLEAARTVEKFINSRSTKRVLELATGRGATSAYLAEKYKEIEFEGIEISQGQLDFAQKKAKKILNYHPILGDYHNLSNYKESSVDIAFVIEALCYSTEKEKVFAEVRRVLKKDGVFIILDGYLRKDNKVMSEDEILACKLTEIGMAIPEFEKFEKVLAIAEKVGLVTESNEDVSVHILPTLRRFEKLAAFFFSSKFISKAFSLFFSKEVTYNAISGYLMPNLIEEGLASYYITVLRKEGK